MKIICEGPDGGGKSTWMKWMVQADANNTLGSDEIPHGVPKTPEEFEERVSKQDEILFYSGFRHTIMDRYTPMSQIVYDEATGRPHLMEHKGLMRRIEWALSKGVIIVYFRPSDQKEVIEKLILKPHKSEEWIERVKTNWPKIREAYDQLFLQLRANGTPIFIYDRCSAPVLEIF